MKNCYHEGTIGIPVKGGKSKIAHYWVKAFQKPSQWGIENGRISKLTVRIDGKITINYDRGWDISPHEDDRESMIAYRILMMKYN